LLHTKSHDIDNGCKSGGALTRYYNKDDYNIYPNSKKELYIARFNNLLDDNYDFKIIKVGDMLKVQ
jgi:hypothetical protein